MLSNFFVREEYFQRLLPFCDAARDQVAASLMGNCN